jgi:membrane protein implicated in regulation of membrane protease activity
MILLAAILLAIFLLPMPWNVLAAVLGLCAEVGEVTFGIWYSRRRRAAADRATRIVGRIARVVEPCRPEGRVSFRGELWPAICSKGADAGERVRITAVNEVTLEVEPAGGER